MSQYISFEENIKNSLLLFAKGELKNEEDFLYDLFEFYSIERMSSLFFTVEENYRVELLDTLNSFIEKHYPILHRRKYQYLKNIENDIKGSPLTVSISFLVKQRIEIQEIITNQNLIKQIELYYKSIIDSLNLLISDYRGYLQFDITHKKELDLYDKLGAFIISKRHDLAFLKKCNELDAQAMEAFLDRCTIIQNGIPYIVRVPFELTQGSDIGIELFSRKDISEKLCYYQLNLFEEIELPILKKNTILNEDKFRNVLYKFFKYINDNITEKDIIIFIQTIKNQMHEKYSLYDRNRVRLLLNKSISEYSEANMLFCAIIYKLLINQVGNKENLYIVLSAYFSNDVSGVNLSKSTLERYIGIQEHGEKLLRNLEEIVKNIINK